MENEQEDRKDWNDRMEMLKNIAALDSIINDMELQDNQKIDLLDKSIKFILRDLEK